MASSKDFEKIWESYQDVVTTKDISIVDYCQRNGIGMPGDRSVASA